MQEVLTKVLVDPTNFLTREVEFRTPLLYVPRVCTKRESCADDVLLLDNFIKRYHIQEKIE